MNLLLQGLFRSTAAVLLCSERFFTAGDTNNADLEQSTQLQHISTSSCSLLFWSSYVIGTVKWNSKTPTCACAESCFAVRPLQIHPGFMQQHRGMSHALTKCKQVCTHLQPRERKGKRSRGNRVVVRVRVLHIVVSLCPSIHTACLTCSSNTTGTSFLQLMILSACYRPLAGLVSHTTLQIPTFLSTGTWQ